MKRLFLYLLVLASMLFGQRLNQNPSVTSKPGVLRFVILDTDTTKNLTWQKLFEFLADSGMVEDNDLSSLIEGISVLSDTTDTLRVYVDLNTAHRTSTGEDHSYISQDVTPTGTPEFASVTADTLETSNYIKVGNTYYTERGYEKDTIWGEILDNGNYIYRNTDIDTLRLANSWLGLGDTWGNYRYYVYDPANSGGFHTIDRNWHALYGKGFNSFAGRQNLIYNYVSQNSLVTDATELRNYSKITSGKLLNFTALNYGNVTNFLYLQNIKFLNHARSTGNDTAAYTPTWVGTRFELENKNYDFAADTAKIDLAHFGFYTVENTATGGAAYIDDFKGFRYGLTNSGDIDDFRWHYIQSPVNTGTIGSYCAIEIDDQRIAGVAGSKPFWSKGGDLVVDNGKVDADTVKSPIFWSGDSLFDQTDIAAWDAAKDSTDILIASRAQDVGIGAAPVLDGTNFTNIGSGDFADGGEAGGANRSLGNTDNYSLSLLANNVAQLTAYGSGWVDIGKLNAVTGIYMGYSAIFNVTGNVLKIGSGSGWSNHYGYIGGALKYNLDADKWYTLVNFGILDGGSNQASLTIGTDDPYAIVLGDTSSTYSKINIADAQFTTSSDSAKKNIVKIKKAGRNAATRDSLFDAITNTIETEYYWNRDKIRRKFKEKYIANFDSLTVFQQDSARTCWNIGEEKRIDRIVSKKRYGPTAQAVNRNLKTGSDVEINWNQVNSAYRQTVQELIVLVKQQQGEIESLKKRVDKLEKKK